MNQIHVNAHDFGLWRSGKDSAVHKYLIIKHSCRRVKPNCSLCWNSLQHKLTANTHLGINSGNYCKITPGSLAICVVTGSQQCHRWFINPVSKSSVMYRLHFRWCISQKKRLLLKHLRSGRRKSIISVTVIWVTTSDLDMTLDV